MTEPWSGWVYDTTEADPLSLPRPVPSEAERQRIAEREYPANVSAADVDRCGSAVFAEFERDTWRSASLREVVGFVLSTFAGDPHWLVPFLTARTAERDEARAQRDSARSWCVALESRLAEVRDVLVNAADSPADRRVRIRQAVRLLEADLA